MIPLIISGSTDGSVLSADALVEEIGVVVADVTAVQEEAAAAGADLKGEAPEDLGLARGEAEVAVLLGEVLHALAEGVDGEVAGAVDYGGVSLAGDQRRDGVHGGEEVGDESGPLRRRSRVVFADESGLGGSGIGQSGVEKEREGEEREEREEECRRHLGRWGGLIRVGLREEEEASEWCI